MKKYRAQSVKSANEKKNLGEGNGDGNIYHSKARMLVLMLHLFFFFFWKVFCLEPCGLEVMEPLFESKARCLIIAL